MPTLLPPPGGDPTEIALYVDALVREAAHDARRLEWEGEVVDGYQMHVGDHWETTTPDVVQVVLNRVQNVVIANVAIQAGDPPKIAYKPRESGEKPIVVLNTDLPEAQFLLPEAMMLAQAANPGVPWQPTDPLPDAAVMKFRQVIAAGEVATAQAAAVGLPPPPGTIPAGVLVEVTDASTAQAIQTIADALWEAEDCQYVFAENVLLKNVYGTQPTLFEWDDDEHRPILTNCHALHVFLDPLNSDPRKSHYTIYDEPLSADEAKERFPGHDQEIDDEFQQGKLRRPGSGNYRPSARVDQQYARDVGYVRHAWLRHQPYPMDEAEAIAKGKVLESHEPTGEWQQGPDGVDEMGLPVPGEAVPITHRVLRHPDGEAATPTILTPDGKTARHPKWPVRFGIRQLTIIARKCVRDAECEFPDVPLPVNSNVLVPNSPYAQGEAYRLKPLQVALNYVLSSIITHQRYNALPVEVIDGGVADSLGPLADVRSRPGQRLQVPPEITARLGNDLSKILQTIEVSALPSDFWKLLDFLVSIIDKEGNLADVMQGNAAAGWSGEAIDSLQNAATQVIKAKSLMTEFWLKRIGRLMAHAIVFRMPPEEWRRYLSGTPWHALQLMHDRAKGLRYDVSVQIASGSGSARQSQTNNLVAARAAGVPISDPEILERLEIDPEADLQKGMDYARKRAAFMPQQPATDAAGGAAANNGGDAAGPAGGRQAPAAA